MQRRIYPMLGFLLLFLLGYFSGGAVRYFVWDHYRRYEVLPWLIPQSERIALSLFRESICAHDPLIKNNSTLLEQAGYHKVPNVEDDDRYSTEVNFARPLRLSVPEFRIYDWEVLQYFWEGDSGGISGIEVRQPLEIVAKALHVSARDNQEVALNIRTSAFLMQGDIGIQLRSTERGTRIGCWVLDG